MLALEVLGGVVVLLALAFVLARDAPMLDDETDDARDIGLPADRLMRSDDIGRLRLRVGLRGYRMEDVDAALDAAQRALAAAEVDGATGIGDAVPELAEQPPSRVERPLSELEDSYGGPDDGG